MRIIFCVLPIQADLAGILIVLMFLKNMLSHVQKREELHTEKAGNKN